MSDKLNIQIQEIKNGFLVIVNEQKMIQTPTGPQMGNFPVPTFCKDYDDVCIHLKGHWPKSLLKFKA